MKNKTRTIVKIIQTIAQKNGLQFQSFSHDWIMRLTWKGKHRHIFGYNFEINSATAQMIAGDKSAVTDILRLAKVPVVEHRLFLTPTLHKKYVGSRGNWKEMAAYAKQFDYQIVCKPIDGTGGNAVYKINHPIALEQAVHKLFQKHRSICLSPLYAIKNEYRVIVLNQVVEILYKKEIPRLVGNGYSTIWQLYLEKFKGVQVSTSILDYLNTLELDLNTILEKDKVLLLNWKHNLGKGATPILLKEATLIKRLSQLALQAAQAINITFASIDIIETLAGEFLVLEINSGIMTESLIKALPNVRPSVEAMYKRAVLMMFWQ